MSKRKKLNMLVLEGDANYEKVNNIIPINFQSHHIVQIFMNYLPKIDLDGSSKLVIYFKEKPDSETQYMHDDYFGVSWYYVEEKDMNYVKNLRKEEINDYYLNLIVNILKYIAHVNNTNEKVIEIIEQTANKVRESKFELLLLQKKLSKVSENKKYKANVYRNINYFGEIWYVEIKDKNTKTTTRYEIMNKHTYISKEEVYKKSYWEDEKFILADRFDGIVATIEIK